MDGKLANPLTNKAAAMQELFTTYYQSPLGPLKISGTSQLILEIGFLDINQVPTPLSNDPLPALLIQATEQLIQYFQGHRRQFELPIFQEGTEFQQSVWQQLYKIPFGKTISYLELSRRMGDTKTIRAAAAANGKNKLAIVVPCHRVIGSKNTLLGYMGGLWRKKWLLDHENKIANGVLTLF